MRLQKLTDLTQLLARARLGCSLPPGFDQWDLADEDGWTVAHEAAQYGHLPPGFDQWGLANKDGWTVAHVAALFDRVPPGFDQWELANKDGRTVAHVAAQYGHLPPGFDQWALADKDGWTVAHEAAQYGHLPPGFDQWELANNGWTVATWHVRCYVESYFKEVALSDDALRLANVAQLDARYSNEILDEERKRRYALCNARHRELLAQNRRPPTMTM